MTQWLRSLTVSDTVLWSLQEPGKHLMRKYTLRQNTPIHRKIKINKSLNLILERIHNTGMEKLLYIFLLIPKLIFIHTHKYM